MKTLVKDPVGADYKALNYTKPLKAHYDEVLTPPFQVVSTAGELLFWCSPVSDLDTTGYDIDHLWSAMRAFKYGQGARTMGTISTSRVIGYQPRNALRQDYCHIAASAREWPAEHYEITRWAKWCSDQYALVNPERYARQKEVLEEKVLPDWRLPESVFTSGICNKANALRYHKDNGNFSNFWSAMISLPLDLVGGNLVLADLRLSVQYKVPTLTMFDGAGIVHGVERILKGERYSLVFYALQQLKNCGTPKEEIVRIRKLKTEREHKRLRKNQQGGEEK